MNFYNTLLVILTVNCSEFYHSLLVIWTVYCGEFNQGLRSEKIRWRIIVILYNTLLVILMVNYDEYLQHTLSLNGDLRWISTTHS